MLTQYTNILFVNIFLSKGCVRVDNRVENKTATDDKRHIRYLRIVFIGVFAFSLIFPAVYRKMDSAVPVVKILDIQTAAEDIEADTGGTSGTDSENGGTYYENETAAVKTIPEKSTGTAVDFPLDINFADVSELVMVKGIGEITARNIVDYRNRYGYFYSLEELTRVDGIGEKKLEALSGYIYIDTDRLPETLPAVSEALSAEEEVVTAAPVTEDIAEETVTAAVTEKEDIPEEELVTGIDENEFADWTETENFWDWLKTSKTTVSLTETESETEYFPVFPLELNSASALDLTYINDIGKATADKIVEYARTVGFMSVDDLLNVNGIGKSKLEMIRPYVYVIPCGTVTAVTEYTETFSDTESENVTTLGIYSVNINTCTKEELMQLPGIDEKLAEDIIVLRETIGGFERIEELGVVLSNEKLNGIWDYVYV